METLTCSCCGAWFQGEHDPSHDIGYGTCSSCQEWIDEKNERDWNGLRDKVADAMSPENRQKFLGMEKELQRGIMLKMMDEGLIEWTISR